MGLNGSRGRSPHQKSANKNRKKFTESLLCPELRFFPRRIGRILRCCPPDKRRPGEVNGARLRVLHSFSEGRWQSPAAALTLFPSPGVPATCCGWALPQPRSTASRQNTRQCQDAPQGIVPVEALPENGDAAGNDPGCMVWDSRFSHHFPNPSISFPIT
jgi:hypothetical protein